jgi:hypothetical protein
VISPAMLVKGFEDTENKRCIRREFDLPILTKFRERVRHKLHYFGLTGTELHDIEDWRAVLATDVMSAQAEPDFVDKVSRMNCVADNLGFQIRVLHGKIEHTMLTGRDIDGELPLRSTQSDGYIFFEYDLLNLDFCGGLFFNRVKAIRELLRRQAKVEHVLFITLNARHQVHEALEAALTDLRVRLGKSQSGEAALKWYELQKQTYQIKAVAPGIITAAANDANLDCRAYPPVIYDGKSTKLIHFAFHMKPHAEVFRGFAAQSEEELLLLPLLYVSQGHLELDRLQAPMFSLSDAKDRLAFLGKRRVAEIAERYDLAVADRS